MFLKIESVCNDPVAGARGLFMVEEDTGASAWEEVLGVDESLLEADIVGQRSESVFTPRFFKTVSVSVAIILEDGIWVSLRCTCNKA